MKNYFNYLKFVLNVFDHHSYLKIMKFVYKIAKDESTQ